MEGPARLQRILSRAGVASRRHAEELIAAGRVRVNGRVVRELGTRADPERDAVTVDGVRVRLPEAATYLALHKPPGYVTTADDPQGRPTVFDLVPDVPGLFPVGRLDLDSEGLLLLTTDGEWAQRVVHPRHGCTKEYLVEVEGRPTPTALARLRRPSGRRGPRCAWSTPSPARACCASSSARGVSARSGAWPRPSVTPCGASSGCASGPSGWATCAPGNGAT
jgi:23S rRNA pseudouridine2605 synthase